MIVAIHQKGSSYELVDNSGDRVFRPPEGRHYIHADLLHEQRTKIVLERFSFNPSV